MKEFKTTFCIGKDLEVNRLGFGAMRLIGKEYWGMPEDPQNSIAILKRAVELGVNFIDTADQYGPFTSENLIAEALYPYQKNVIIATKGGLVRYGPLGQLNNDATPQHLEGALEGSLKRLKLEQIDLYQLHRIDPNVPAEVSFGFLQKAQKDGKIKHIGLSEVSVEEIKLAQQFFTVASVQNRYSIDNREWEPVLEYCKTHDIAFIPWFPIGGGEMKGQDILNRVAERHNITIRQLALSWLLHHADNILLIPGTSNMDHLEANLEVASIRLHEEDMNELDNVYQPAH
jgi:pyridoxine 4-dehydrogenase